MELTNGERAFLAKRTKLVKSWRYIGVVLLLAVIGLGFWLVRYSPFLADPFMVLSRLQSDSISPSVMRLATGLLPLVVLMCLLLTLAIVLFTFAFFANERRYLIIIQRMTGGAAEEAEERKGSGGNRHRPSP